MQQRQPRLGDVLDDYCPRERRLTNHVVVAMIGEDVKQTRCTTCDADHEYKHARIPRQRRKGELPAIAAPVAVAPKRVTHEAPSVPAPEVSADDHVSAEDQLRAALGISTNETDTEADAAASELPESRDDGDEPAEGFAHRRLIRAQLPKHEGQQQTQRQAPDFTIRQPTGGRPGGRFRPRHPRAAVSFQGNRGGGGGGNFNGNQRGGGPRPQGGGGGPQRQGGKRHK